MTAGRGKSFFTFTVSLQQLWGPPDLLFSGYQWRLSQEESGGVRTEQLTM